MQIAADFKLHVTALALLHAIAHVMAGGFRHLQRQVAMYTRPIGALQHTLQLQITRQAIVCLLSHMPCRMQRALCVGIGKLRLRHLHFDAAVFHRPAQLCL